jgi:GNAT superfamily N-acetyltransferase
MAIEIKLLAPGEGAILQHVAPGVFDDPIHPARAAEFLADPRHHLAAAIDDGSVVGFVSAVHYVHPDKPAPELWINEVSVAVAHRRCGLATRLLRRVFEQARTLGCSEAWVLTDRSNPAAMRLYTAAGATNPPADAVMFTFRLDDRAAQDPAGRSAVDKRDRTKW